MGKKALTLHMDEKIVDDFRHYCQLNALKLSAKVELLFKKEMKTAHSNPTLIKLFEDILEKQIFKKASKVPEQIRIETEKDYPNNNNNNNSDNDKTQKTNKQTVEKQDKSSVPKNIQKTDKIIKPVPSIDHLRKVKGL